LFKSNLNFEIENSCQLMFSLEMLWLTEKFYKFEIVGNVMGRGVYVPFANQTLSLIILGCARSLGL